MAVTSVLMVVASVLVLNDYSLCTSACQSPPPGLVAPTNLSAVASSSSSIDVTWVAIILDCPSFMGYTVVHDNGTQNNSVTVNASTIEAMITGLPAFTNITVFVAANNGSGAEGPAAMVVETTLLQGNGLELLLHCLRCLLFVVLYS